MEETKFLKRKSVDTFNANRSRQPLLDLLRLKPVTRYAFASTRFGFRNPNFALLNSSANPLVVPAINNKKQTVWSVFYCYMLDAKEVRMFCIRNFDIKEREFDIFSRKFAKIKAITPKK